MIFQSDTMRCWLWWSSKEISQTILMNLQIPLPPLPIQEEIVAEIESYQKIIDGARQVVENYKPRIDIDPEWEEYAVDQIFHSISLRSMKAGL